MTVPAALLVFSLALGACGSSGEDQDHAPVSIPHRAAYSEMLEDAALGSIVEGRATGMTVFAPSDEAIAEARAGHPELFASDDQKAFVAKLQVVPGRLAPADLVSHRGSRLRTVAGISFEVGGSGGATTIDGQGVGAVLVDQDDLIIYRLDGILLPPS